MTMPAQTSKRKILWRSKMNEKITYRHNTMSINSLEEFVNIKGGCHNGLRDVYFIRAIGEIPNMDSIIIDIDKKMDSAAANNRLSYYRISELPRFIDCNETAFYSKSYAEWSKGEPIKLHTECTNKLFDEILVSATRKTIEQYKIARKNATDTIIKNFVIKLWYWTDTLLKDVITNWTERLTVKIIIDDIKKDQEYLFLYMITLLGCDVLILNNKSDIKIEKSVARLSYELKLGKFGSTVFPKYKAQKQNSVKQDTSENKKITHASDKICENNRSSQRNKVNEKYQKNENLNPRSIVNNSLDNNQTGHSSNESANGYREKSFEDLALLASSIVMIAVHDNTGKPIATGSGIMIGRDGFILTNNHVVRGGRFYAVQIEYDDQVYITDEVIKYNSKLDLAIIRIKKRLEPLKIYNGKKQLARGQKVVAIGSPLGLFNSVSDGIISGFRTIQDVNMIQFTAPISHGSSGGAVLNMNGELIGISTAGIDSGQNINLAVDYKDISMFAKGFY